VTAADVFKPPTAPVEATHPIPAGIRLAWLHLRTRRVPGAVLALAVCGALLHAALRWHWAFNTGPYAQQVPMIIEAGAATGRSLPYLRLLTAIGLTGIAILALQLGAAGENLNDGILALARNVIGFTGLGLACSLVTGGLLAWTLPIGYMAFCQYALLEAWTAPGTWPVRPPADRGAWICACAVFAAGLLLFTIRGPRTRLSDGS